MSTDETINDPNLLLPGESANLPVPVVDQSLQKPRIPRILKTLIWVVTLSIGGFCLVTFIMSRPPAPNVIATFQGGQVTADDLKSHIELLTNQKVESLGGIDLKTLTAIAEEMVYDELARRWGATRQVEKEERINHQMVHVNDEIDLNNWHESMHKSGMGINQSDIEAYYNANKEKYTERTLSESRDEIEEILKSQGEDNFVVNYLAGLRNNADIQRNFDVLDAPEPTPEEMFDYYQKNLDHFSLQEVAYVDEIRIEAMENRTQAQGAADRIRQKIIAGADPAAALGEDEKISVLRENLLVTRDVRDDGTQLAAKAFDLSPGQISAPYEIEGAIFLVRLRKKDAARQLQFSEVSGEVRLSASAEKLAAWFEDRKDSPVFYVNGIRLSAGEFWQEYQELPSNYRIAYSGSVGRKRLAEKLIERYLVVMENTVKKVGNETEMAKETRTQLIKQLIDNEEIDTKSKVTEEEIRVYYEKNRSRFSMPPKSQIRQIKIAFDTADKDVQQAMALAEAAYKKLSPGWPKTAANFDEVAKEYDSAALAGQSGAGESRWVGEGSEFSQELIDHAFHEQVDRIGVGEVGKPFVARDGVYIVQVLDRAKATPLGLSEMKNYIEEELEALKHERIMEEFQAKIFQENSVRFFNSVLSGLMADLGSEGKSGKP